MKRTKYGAIDIGSNAIRLLLVNVYEGEDITTYKKVSLVRVPLRLGSDVFKKKMISEQKAIDFERTMMAFDQLMKVHKVDQYRACATSAMRDASNGPDLVEAVRDRTGINIEIISGDEEAAIIRSTHIEERLEQNHDFLYVDVGGGSTEISFYCDGELQDSHSFNIGTIRMLNRRIPDKKWEAMKEWVKKTTQKRRDLDLIGSGGNINKIYKLLKKDNWEPIKRYEIKGILEEMRDLTVEERMLKYLLHPDRADVIVPAAIIFERIMKWAGSSEIQVPKLGLADGLIKSMHENLSFANY